MAKSNDWSFLSRRDFPRGFVFGVGSSAFQYEGAVDEDGRGPSIWEPFIKKAYPDIYEADGLKAIDHYHRYKEDVKIAKEMGWNSYRFSISWSRILPDGRRSRLLDGKVIGVNQLGVDFYNSLIDELLANGIQPVATIYHWDLPDCLEKEYNGFLSERVVADLVDFADLCFSEFGDRVKTWITLNEPYTCAVGGLGTMAPGRGVTSARIRDAMKDVLPGSTATSADRINRTPLPEQGNRDEMYTVARNQLLAHAAMVKLYRNKYQKKQHGKIGISLVTMWGEPYHDTEEDKHAARRCMDFTIGWYMDPITYGKYPDSMTRLLGHRLQPFSEKESDDLKGSFDFVGLNYYTGRYTKNNPPGIKEWYIPDSQVVAFAERDGVPIGEKAGSDWLYIYPEGIFKLLLFVKEIYHNPLIYITENGVDEENDESQSPWDSLMDNTRISYHYSHLCYVKEAIMKGVNVKGYYAWSLHDNLEWGQGFKSRFGINFIDYKTGLTRFPKLSVGWFKSLLRPINIPI